MRRVPIAVAAEETSAVVLVVFAAVATSCGATGLTVATVFVVGSVVIEEAAPAATEEAVAAGAVARVEVEEEEEVAVGVEGAEEVRN